MHGGGWISVDFAVSVSVRFERTRPKYGGGITGVHLCEVERFVVLGQVTLQGGTSCVSFYVGSLLLKVNQRPQLKAWI